jgi:hypothetical protein
VLRLGRIAKYPAEARRAADCLQRPLRSCRWRRLTAGVEAVEKRPFCGHTTPSLILAPAPAQKLSSEMNVELVVSQEVFGRHADGSTSQPHWGKRPALPLALCYRGPFLHNGIKFAPSLLCIGRPQARGYPPAYDRPHTPRGRGQRGLPAKAASLALQGACDSSLPLPQAARGFPGYVFVHNERPASQNEPCAACNREAGAGLILADPSASMDS